MFVWIISIIAIIIAAGLFYLLYRIKVEKNIDCGMENGDVEVDRVKKFGTRDLTQV